jgi:hypothetical protein
MMGYREDCIGWSEGEAGHAYRVRHAERPLCGQRRWTGSHVACVCHADHEGPHESAEGDRWEGE